MTKEHYEELVTTVEEKHNDAGNRRFGCELGRQMKMLKMFTVLDPTSDALAYLRDHQYVREKAVRKDIDHVSDA